MTIGLTKVNRGTNMTYEQGKLYCFNHEADIRLLAARGHKLARIVINRYQEAERLEDSLDKKRFAQAAGNFLGYLNEYIAGTLHLPTREAIQSKFGLSPDKLPEPK